MNYSAFPRLSNPNLGPVTFLDRVRVHFPGLMWRVGLIIYGFTGRHPW